MEIVLFDLGGTLVDDPFEEVLAALYNEYLDGRYHWSLEKDDVSQFLKYWRDENAKTDFPFASHFLQEETWLSRALLRLNGERGVPPIADIPLLSPAILRRYRELAHTQISAQSQLPLLREIFTWLKRSGAAIGVASNDREFATKTMLIWADLASYQNWVFTSEGLSQKYPKAEKPAVEFFHAIFAEIGRPASEWDHVVYVGDSEDNDILPASSLGLCTVRYFNKRDLRNATLTHSATKSLANYQFAEHKQLLSILAKILGSREGDARWEKLLDGG